MENIARYKFISLSIIIFFYIFSLYMIYSSSSIWAKYKFNDEFYYLKRQFIYVIIALIILNISRRINILKYEKYYGYFLLFSLILLILVLIKGIGIVRGGSSSWLGFSFFNFQPSEIYKITLILYTSSYLNKIYRYSKKIQKFIILFIFILLGAVLIMLEPDFGSLIVILGSIAIMIFLSKLPYSYFIYAMISGIILCTVLIIFSPYRKDRIISFIDPFSDPLGTGFQIIQSYFSLGKGGLIGLGINESIQKHYYLPEPQTDFIYALIVEEFGLIGGGIIILLYGILFYAFYKIIKNTLNPLGYFIKVGFASLIIIQVLINLGVVVGLLPVTGITLPFLSYGGSSLIVLSFSCGVINSNI